MNDQRPRRRKIQRTEGRMEGRRMEGRRMERRRRLVEGRENNMLY